jgi:hypothetical protein
VPAGPFQAAFTRSTALDPRQQGVAFLTPVHPLVRAVLQRVRARLYEGRARDRLAVRSADSGGDGWLFTATGRVLTDDGHVLEEPLIPGIRPLRRRRTWHTQPRQPGGHPAAPGPPRPQRR